MAVLNIKDAEAHALAAELARRTGHSLTQVVKEALRERLERERSSPRRTDRLVERAMELGRRISSRWSSIRVHRTRSLATTILECRVDGD